MATLSVLKFDDTTGAHRMLIALQGMQDRKMITVEDAALVTWPKGSKKPRIPQDHFVGEMALGGAFWGFLFGLIFFVPFLGAAIGAGATASLSSSMREGGRGDEGHLRLRDPLDQSARRTAREAARGLRQLAAAS